MIGRQWATLGRIQRPVLSGTPRAAEFVTRSPKLPTASATSDNFTFAWEQRRHSQTATSVFVSERVGVYVRSAAVTNISSLFRRCDGGFPDAVQKPNLFQILIGGSHAIENDQHVIRGRVCQLASEPFHLRRLIRVSRIAARVHVLTVVDVSHFHVTGGPQVARPVEVFAAADRVPVARRIHALAAVICRRPKILGPKKLLAWLVNEHRVVCD